MSHNCLESINSIYVEKSEEGYAVSPCCLYKDTKRGTDSRKTIPWCFE